MLGNIAILPCAERCVCPPSFQEIFGDRSAQIHLQTLHCASRFQGYPCAICSRRNFFYTEMKRYEIFSDRLKFAGIQFHAADISGWTCSGNSKHIYDPLKCFSGLVLVFQSGHSSPNSEISQKVGLFVNTALLVDPSATLYSLVMSKIIP